MRQIHVNGASVQSRILIGEKLENLVRYLPEDRQFKVVVVTDSHLMQHYGDFLRQWPVILTGTGEKNKNIESVSQILSELVRLEADRTTFVVGVGGGIVCDMTGFAASIYMRGLRFGFVSTTLLSQVDASVGGKNGVNLMGFKNMVGTFQQPEFVLCDPEMLKTLDEKEFRAGFAEIIKAGAISDADLFHLLELSAPRALERDSQVLEELVYRSVEIKAGVVSRDEKEQGERRILNFGHTFGHALEHMTGMLHGEAIGIGMTIAAALSVRMGLLPHTEANRLKALSSAFNLPVDTALDMPGLLLSIRKDKKREGDALHLVLLNQIGHAVVQKITFAELEQLTHDLRKYF